MVQMEVWLEPDVHLQLAGVEQGESFDLWLPHLNGHLVLVVS